jgi:hypothetical protein
MNWEKTAEEKFKQLIAKVPVFLRDMAHKKVFQKAENLAQANNRLEVSEKDMVDAFFCETPFGFHGPMKCDMETVGLDYKKYGYN